MRIDIPRNETVKTELVILALFAIAFGYVEGSVVHYLRLHYYPGGFDFDLKDIEQRVLAVEIGREFCTMVILTTVAALSTGPRMRRLCNFVYIFAVWDITYYAALYSFEGWPQSLLTWDVLFLIPVPWYGPVIAPIALSICGIIGTLLVHASAQRNRTVILRSRQIYLLLAATALCLITFMRHPSNIKFPEHYDWALFLTGMVMIACAFAFFIKDNFLTSNHKRR